MDLKSLSLKFSCMRNLHLIRSVLETGLGERTSLWSKQYERYLVVKLCTLCSLKCSAHLKRSHGSREFWGFRLFMAEILFFNHLAEKSHYAATITFNTWAQV